MKSDVTVIGAGLAGCEAAWQLAKRGIRVTLAEMKPKQYTPAHKSESFAELVCSNSLRGAAVTTGPGLLKEELRICKSLLIECADETAVPAGGALAVDRQAFSAAVTQKMCQCENIEIIQESVDTIPTGNVIIATGPLTAGGLAREIESVVGEPMFFYDAAAPIVSFDSIDMDRAWIASRYDKGTADYINCPMTREEYTAFVRELQNAQEAPVHGFEDTNVFEGCMPVEVMARRGEETLRFGPLKPVGLRDPKSGERPYAVVQLRADNKEKTIYNIVGFQTHLKFPEQKRVFGMIPALAKAEFLRYGVMHRNSFINSPGRLDGFYRVIGRDELMFAGQITGVEGYVESIASGLYSGINMACRLQNKPEFFLNGQSAIGALARHVSGYEGAGFQPMNINFGIIDSLEYRVKGKRQRYEQVAQKAIDYVRGEVEKREDIFTE